jgi:hypothetical protein
MDAKFNHQGFEILALQGDYAEGGVPTPEALEYCSQLIRSLDEFRRFAATHLLALYNETWLDDEIGPVTQEQFLARLTDPKIVLMDERGAADVYFQDGGLFAGHGIQVSIDRGIPTDANLVG